MNAMRGHEQGNPAARRPAVAAGGLAKTRWSPGKPCSARQWQKSEGSWQRRGRKLLAQVVGFSVYRAMRQLAKTADNLVRDGRLPADDRVDEEYLEVRPQYNDVQMRRTRSSIIKLSCSPGAGKAPQWAGRIIVSAHIVGRGAKNATRRGARAAARGTTTGSSATTTTPRPGRTRSNNDSKGPTATGAPPIAAAVPGGIRPVL
jgi:hypothetical protein